MTNKTARPPAPGTDGYQSELLQQLADFNDTGKYYKMHTFHFGAECSAVLRVQHLLSCIVLLRSLTLDCLQMTSPQLVSKHKRDY